MTATKNNSEMLKIENFDNSLSTNSFVERLKEAACIKIIGCNPFVETFTSQTFMVELRKKIVKLYDEGIKNENPFFTLYMESEQEDFYQKLVDTRGSVYYKKTYIDKKARIFGEKQANYKSALIAEITKQLLSIARLEGESVDKELLDFVDKNIIIRQLNYRFPYYAMFISFSDNKEETWYSPLTLNVPDINDLIFLDKSITGYKRTCEEISRMLLFLETEDFAIKDSNTAHAKGLRTGMGGKKFTSLPNSELLEAYDK